MDLFRVAVVQAGSVAFDRERSTAKALDLTSRAAAAGARLVVFPEAFLSGYPKGIDFGARVGMRTPEGRKWFRAYYESALDVPGPEALALGAAAREHGIWLVIGVIERAGRPLWNASSGASATARRCPWSTRPAADSARSSAGRTTCRCCARRCTRRAS